MNQDIINIIYNYYHPLQCNYIKYNGNGKISCISRNSVITECCLQRFCSEHKITHNNNQHICLYCIDEYVECKECSILRKRIETKFCISCRYNYCNHCSINGIMLDDNEYLCYNCN